ncbi:PilZ domain-containing protein [Nisaea denitrificans]|uniref:PilZ domain-containing protein n=1 Tax=Nisaea denitrificans TaxID=390877 RepID=UPI0003FC5273|nr:PilZ domain-containing protein [Nisaea denitrificans]
MLNAILQAIGLSSKDERRQFERYPVTSPIEVTVVGKAHNCIIDNVSVGGLRLEPPVDAEPGADLTIKHPESGLNLTGQLIGNDTDGSRISFNSSEAGAVVSVWLRMMHEQLSEETRPE